MAVESFRFQSCLTPSQQAIYQQLSPKLQKAIGEQLLVSQPQYIKIAQLVLDIFKFDNSEALEIKEKFFLKILNDQDCDKQLEKVLRVCQREGQARGRAGRQGQKGSSEIVIALEHLNLSHLINPDNNDSLTSEKHAALVTALIEKRASQARMMKSLHIVQSNIERYCFTFVQKFFDLFGQFHHIMEQGKIIRQWATKLSTRKITPKDINLSLLHPKDRQIAQTALTLLTDIQENALSWRILLEQIADRLEDNIIQSWSTQFYRQTDTMLSQSGATANALVRNKLQENMSKIKADNVDMQLFQFLEAVFTQQQQQNLDQLEQDIQTLYSQHKNEWEKVLHPSGLGIIQYLRKITQTSLKGLETA